MKKIHVTRPITTSSGGIMNRSIVILLSVVIAAATLGAQPTYKRKVVSYVDNVLAPSSLGLTARQTAYITETVNRAVRLDRFDYASLPSSVTAQFSSEASRLNSSSADQARPLIERTLAPKFLEFLDVNKEMLSKKNLTEAERNTFLATKAQAAGLSASQLEAILNSGFFYVPYVSSFHRSESKGEREEKNDQGKVVKKIPTVTVSVEIELGVHWFQLKVDKSNTASVVFIGSANGWKGSAIERSETKDVESGADVEWTAFTEAVGVSAINIGNESKKMGPFQLTGTVSETTTFGVKMSLGSREGLGVDDTYWVEEEQETESGDVVKVRRGFIKVREVANNARDESAVSYAQTITGTNYSPGLSVSEIPLLGINGIGAFGKIPVKISKFDDVFVMSDSKKNFWLRIDEDYSGMLGPMVALQADLARSTKVPELWLNLSAAVGFPNVQGKFFFQDYSGSSLKIDSSVNAGPGIGGYADIGLLKKIYLRRFGLILQADLRYNLTYLTGTGKDKNGADLNYKLMHGAIGYDGKIGMEIYLTPTLSIGGGAEYSGAAANNEWNITVTDKDNNDTKLENAKGPDVTYSGLGWFVWFNYSLPSLF